MTTNSQHPDQTAAPTVLWWSRSGREYSRDRVIRSAFQTLGWAIEDFSPTFSSTADLEATLRRVRVPDLVWVPCFRQRDAAAAERWARRRNVPVVFDPLISAWDKQVFERQKFSEDSRPARQLLRWEATLFRNCDALIADTECHAEFFARAHGIDASKLVVVPVSAEEAFFSLQPVRVSADRLNVLFYGSFIGLQGPQFIAQAATQVPEVNWTFIGSGPLLDGCRHIVGKAQNVQFIPRVPYDELAIRIGQADVLLGVFGTSQKAGRVIPNKVYQSLSCGRAVITRTSSAYSAELRSLPTLQSGISWVREGDSREIAAAVRRFAAARSDVQRYGVAAKATYQRWFSNRVVCDSLARLLQQLCPGCANRLADVA